jgi:hypothetical protein
MSYHWGVYFYALKYDVKPRAIVKIGMNRLDGMTEIGRDLIGIITRLETKTRSVPRTVKKREAKKWFAPVIKKMPESVGIERMWKLAGRLK